MKNFTKYETSNSIDLEAETADIKSNHPNIIFRGPVKAYVLPAVMHVEIVF